jgi:hypothetical protein
LTHRFDCDQDGGMVGSIKARGSIAAGAVIWALAGCGGGASHNPISSSSTRSATTEATTSTAPIHAPAGTPVVDLPGLGSLSYRCDGTGRRVLASLGGGVMATEDVTVERDSGQHLLRATIDGRSQVTVPFAAYRSLIWRVVQSTEPRTLEATVRLDFNTGPAGTRRLIGCSLTRWTSTVNVIDHSGKWSPPPAWP